MPPRAPDPFGAIRTALRADQSAGAEQFDTYPVRLDAGRESRTGIPEVIYAPGKSTAQIVAAISGLLDASGQAIISRVSGAVVDEVRSHFPQAVTHCGEGMRTARVTTRAFVPRVSGGRVGVVTAGTSDLPAADEAAVIAAAMGSETRIIADVGVAGLHRLFRPLEELFAWGCDALVVVAGMDGALPSVISGLAPVPVIGLPAMTGYGMGGRGEAALLSMLQTCAPGLVVVNIDNGIGAGIAAARIASQSAAARQRREMSPERRSVADGDS